MVLRCVRILRILTANIIRFDNDRETLARAARFAVDPAVVFSAAREDDADLMTEIRSFLIEPALHIPLLGEDTISYIAVWVVRWLQVRLISRPPRAHLNLFPMTVFLL